MISLQKLSCAVLVALAAILAMPSLAQQLPTLSYEHIIFNRVTSNAISPIPQNGAPGTSCSTAGSICAVQNNGMGEHLISICIVSGTVATMSFSLEGSNDTALVPNFWQQITRTISLTGTSGCVVAEGAGYYQWLRLDLRMTGTTPVVSAYYSGFGTAIPGAGLIFTGKTSQPGTWIPNQSLFNDAVQSTPVSLNSTLPIAIYGVHISNPNATPVFVHVYCNAVVKMDWEVQGNTGRDPTEGPTGTECDPPSTVNCSTSDSTGTGDPGTGCIITVLQKPFAVVNTEVNFDGTVVSTQTQAPN
jgi:hypothetical protein